VLYREFCQLFLRRAANVAHYILKDRVSLSLYCRTERGFHIFGS
jgi:hypothetical protein